MREGGIVTPCCTAAWIWPLHSLISHRNIKCTQKALEVVYARQQCVLEQGSKLLYQHPLSRGEVRWGGVGGLASRISAVPVSLASVQGAGHTGQCPPRLAGGVGGVDGCQVVHLVVTH